MNSLNKKIHYFPVSLLVVCVIFIFDFFGLSVFLQTGFSYALRPVRGVVVSLVQRVEQPLFMIKRSVNSARKVQMLEYRYSEVLAQLSSLDELKKENQELKNILENSDRQARTVVIASPIVSQVGPSIGVGLQDGVEKGDLVFVAQTLVGRVSEVYENHAMINLVSDKNFEPLVVETEEGFKGIIKGNGRHPILTEVLSEETPSIESRIITSGQVGVDRGLFVGQVGKTISAASDPVQTFTIIQYVDFYQASVVEVYK